MNRAEKATLLSALGFPGAGHLYLGRYLAGAVLVCIAAALLYALASAMMGAAADLAAAIARGELAADPAVILERLLARGATGASPLAGVALVGVWLFGIYDVYRVGRAMESDSG